MGVLLLLYGMHVYFPDLPLPQEIIIYIDNSEVVRRGASSLPPLGIKQQLVLDYDFWATTTRLLEAIPCNVQWKWVKGHYALETGPQ